MGHLEITEKLEWNSPRLEVYLICVRVTIGKLVFYQAPVDIMTFTMFLVIVLGMNPYCVLG
jgi:hypothetical protein